MAYRLTDANREIDELIKERDSLRAQLAEARKGWVRVLDGEVCAKCGRVMLQRAKDRQFYDADCPCSEVESAAKVRAAAIEEAAKLILEADHGHEEYAVAFDLAKDVRALAPCPSGFRVVEACSTCGFEKHHQPQVCSNSFHLPPLGYVEVEAETLEKVAKTGWAAVEFLTESGAGCDECEDDQHVESCPAWRLQFALSALTKEQP